MGAPPYRNAYDWGDDIHARYSDRISCGRAVPRGDALLRGAAKNLRAGVTTVVHHDPWESQLDTFPLRVLRIRHAHSLRTTPQFDVVEGERFMIHLAEGTDGSSAEEIRELERRAMVNDNLIAVHVVGADSNGIRSLREAGAAIVWCPTSNLFLLGRTASSDLLAAGADVLLGSDSLLSGAGTLLDEMWVARELGLISDERLLAAVGSVAARRLGVAEPSLEIGERADIVVFRRPVLEASTGDVALVIANGRVRVLDPVLCPALGELQSAGEITQSDGVERWVSFAM
jgi:hypothetical protein